MFCIPARNELNLKTLICLFLSCEMFSSPPAFSDLEVSERELCVRLALKIHISDCQYEIVAHISHMKCNGEFKYVMQMRSQLLERGNRIDVTLVQSSMADVSLRGERLCR